MFTSTSIALLIIASRFVNLLSLNNRVKSLSKESSYHNYVARGGSLTSTGIEFYTFKKWVENSCTVSFGDFFILLYCVNNYKGFFLSPHLFKKDVLNVEKSRMLMGRRDLNHFLPYPEWLYANNLIFAFS
jgi:hypothetical protein